jgi:antitoxin (DNA-binding transcriptional repressor) of toxin-antitoxin stability system
MEKTIGAFEARRQLGRMLTDVLVRGDSYVVERYGRPVAALIPVRIYEQWKRSRQAFFDQMESAAARAGMDEDEASALVAKAIRGARASEHS